MNQIHDDEISLFEFFETLWDGKWLISAFALIAVLVGSVFLLSKDSAYESKIIYSFDTLPPLFEESKVLADFQKKFYSASVFEDWKKNRLNTSIVYEDFSATKVVDGFLLAKEENERLATFVFPPTGDSFILLKTSQLLLLNDFFNYANYTNEVLRKEYVLRAEMELDIIEGRFKDLASVDNTISETFLSIDRYIFSSEKGANILAIQRPTMPKKVSPKSLPILTMSVVLGGISGVFFILVRNHIRKRKELLDEM